MSADNKKSPKSAKRTSKPAIVTNRPILKDPLAVANEDTVEGDADKEKLTHAAGPKLKPLKETPQTDATGDDADKAVDDVADDKQPSLEPETKQEKKEGEGPEDHPTTESEDARPQQKARADAAEQAKHDATIQKLVDSRKYELPINTVEKRKTKRFVVLGVLLAIFLALVWVDVALDAGLIRIDGVEPVTRFFSN